MFIFFAVEEVSEESRELLRQAFEEAEAEMKRKMELIQQIRAMEATPKSRNKLVDWTATAGHSLLSEMSVAEVGNLDKISINTNWTIFKLFTVFGSDLLGIH